MPGKLKLFLVSKRGKQ